MKLLFHDVDGCLNDESGSSLPLHPRPPSERQRTELDKLGSLLDSSDIDQLILNTGRALQDTLLLVSSIASDKLTHLIVEHGTQVYDVKLGQLLPTPPKMRASLEQITRLIDWYQETGQNVLNEAMSSRIRAIHKQTNLTLLSPENIDDHLLYEQVVELIDQSPFAPEHYIVHHSKPDRLVDVLSLIDKGDGVSWCIDSSGLRDVETFAIGNGVNDLPMMERVDHCLCPANSEPELIQYCQQNGGLVSEHTYIAATNNWLKQRLSSESIT